MIHFPSNVICFEPIGQIHSPFKTAEGMPIQPFGGKSERGYIELLPQFENALKDLDGFTHLTLIYCFHKVDGFDMQVTPFMDTEAHGLFATRVPRRPNPIGLSTVRLEKIEGNRIYINEIDILDGTPLLDIKPYFRQFDNRLDAVSGWLEKQENLSVENKRSDDRFALKDESLQA